MHNALVLLGAEQPTKEPMPALHTEAGKTRRIALLLESATSNPPEILSSVMSRWELNRASEAGPF